ncbi:MAG: efflux RND transporter periplasmic adaptor subunit, partial [Mesorhizobium sp.]
MRGKIVLAMLAVACLVAAGLYLSPAATDKVRQMLSAGQAVPDTPAAAANAARPTTVVAATASTADFPIRRYAIGFVSSPAVVSVNARISSQITSITVKDGQMV